MTEVGFLGFPGAKYIIQRTQRSQGGRTVSSPGAQLLAFQS